MLASCLKLSSWSSLLAIVPLSVLHTFNKHLRDDQALKA
jgi:hypothetical protein